MSNIEKMLRYVFGMIFILICLYFMAITLQFFKSPEMSEMESGLIGIAFLVLGAALIAGVKIRIIARVFIGLVFIFSGFVKAVDPLGTTYKFTDYFNAMGLAFMEPLANALSLLMNSAEFLIGMALVIGLRMRITAWAVSGFMAFFLPLTLYIAIKNPVTDCGCFGDALIMSNWATFWKNVFFSAVAAVVFINRNKYEELYCSVVEWSLVGGIVVFIMGISIFGLRHLPIIDFRPYKIGNHIESKMEVPEGEKTDKYITMYTMKNKKSGETKEMSSDEYIESKIWEDTLNWEIASIGDPVLVEKGYEPPIHDFNFSNEEGEDITSDLLYSDNYTFLLVSYKLDKANKSAIDSANKIAMYAQEKGYNFYGATSTLQSDIDAMKNEKGLVFDYFLADEIMLKTIVRSNPGLVLIKDGVVLDKWHHNDFPSIEQMHASLLSQSVSKLKSKNEAQLIFNIMLYVLVFFSVFKYIRNLIQNKKEEESK